MTDDAQKTDGATPRPTGIPLGRLIAVSGSQALVLLFEPGEDAELPFAPPEMGTLLKIETPRAMVVGLVSALTVPVPSHDPSEREVRIVEIEFVGELCISSDGERRPFRRGVSNYPAIGNQVYYVGNDELSDIYTVRGECSVQIGTVVQGAGIPASVGADDLLGKHFAILGSTGTGKSCASALVLRRILERTPQAHIVLLDPHREYAPAFGDLAEVITSDTLDLPFWLLTFEEIVEIVISHQPNRETDIEILRELIPMAKARYGANQRRGDLRTTLMRVEKELSPPSVDTPVPYRISDLIALIEEHIGKLELRGELAPFKRLKARLEAVSHDPRYAFMFGNLTVQDDMTSILSRIFRVPVDGRPISIVELAGLPAEVINVVVSVLSRMSFDLAMWSRGKVPVTLVCEEAHRYVPADTNLGFEPAKRALARIAKEGRKYGVSLCIVSQRPAELDPTILSQCNTIFGLRLPNERDQAILRARVSDASASLLEVLPTLSTGEAVAFGEGVALPTRIRFDTLSDDAMPRSRTAQFSKMWQSDTIDRGFLGEIVEHWRARNRSAPEAEPAAPADEPTPEAASAADEEISAVALAEAMIDEPSVDDLMPRDTAETEATTEPVATPEATAPDAQPRAAQPAATVSQPAETAAATLEDDDEDDGDYDVEPSVSAAFRAILDKPADRPAETGPPSADAERSDEAPVHDATIRSLTSLQKILERQREPE